MRLDIFGIGIEDRIGYAAFGPLREILEIQETDKALRRRMNDLQAAVAIAEVQPAGRQVLIDAGAAIRYVFPNAIDQITHQAEHA